MDIFEWLHELQPYLCFDETSAEGGASSPAQEEEQQIEAALDDDEEDEDVTLPEGVTFDDTGLPADIEPQLQADADAMLQAELNARAYELGTEMQAGAQPDTYAASMSGAGLTNMGLKVLKGDTGEGKFVFEDQQRIKYGIPDTSKPLKELYDNAMFKDKNAHAREMWAAQYGIPLNVLLNPETPGIVGPNLWQEFVENLTPDIVNAWDIYTRTVNGSLATSDPMGLTTPDIQRASERIAMASVGLLDLNAPDDTDLEVRSKRVSPFYNPDIDHTLQIIKDQQDINGNRYRVESVGINGRGLPMIRITHPDMNRDTNRTDDGEYMEFSTGTYSMNSDGTMIGMGDIMPTVGKSYPQRNDPDVVNIPLGNGMYAQGFGYVGSDQIQRAGMVSDISRSRGINSEILDLRWKDASDDQVSQLINMNPAGIRTLMFNALNITRDAQGKVNPLLIPADAYYNMTPEGIDYARRFSLLVSANYSAYAGYLLHMPQDQQSIINNSLSGQQYNDQVFTSKFGFNPGAARSQAFDELLPFWNIGTQRYDLPEYYLESLQSAGTVKEQYLAAARRYFIDNPTVDFNNRVKENLLITNSKDITHEYIGSARDVLTAVNSWWFGDWDKVWKNPLIHTGAPGKFTTVEGVPVYELLAMELLRGSIKPGEVASAIAPRIRTGLKEPTLADEEALKIIESGRYDDQPYELLSKPYGGSPIDRMRYNILSNKNIMDNLLPDDKAAVLAELNNVERSNSYQFHQWMYSVLGVSFDSLVGSGISAMWNESVVERFGKYIGIPLEIQGALEAFGGWSGDTLVTPQIMERNRQAVEAMLARQEETGIEYNDLITTGKVRNLEDYLDYTSKDMWKEDPEKYYTIMSIPDTAIMIISAPEMVMGTVTFLNSLSRIAVDITKTGQVWRSMEKMNEMFTSANALFHTPGDVMQGMKDASTVTIGPKWLKITRQLSDVEIKQLYATNGAWREFDHASKIQKILKSMSATYKYSQRISVAPYSPNVSFVQEYDGLVNEYRGHLYQAQQYINDLTATSDQAMLEILANMKFDPAVMKKAGYTDDEIRELMAVWEKFERTGILDTARASSTKSIADMSWGMAAKHRALMDYTTGMMMRKNMLVELVRHMPYGIAGHPGHYVSSYATGMLDIDPLIWKYDDLVNLLKANDKGAIKVMGEVFRYLRDQQVDPLGKRIISYPFDKMTKVHDLLKDIDTPEGRLFFERFAVAMKEQQTRTIANLLGMTIQDLEASFEKVGGAVRCADGTDIMTEIVMRNIDLPYGAPLRMPTDAPTRAALAEAEAIAKPPEDYWHAALKDDPEAVFEAEKPKVSIYDEHVPEEPPLAFPEGLPAEPLPSPGPAVPIPTTEPMSAVENRIRSSFFKPNGMEDDRRSVLHISYRQTIHGGSELKIYHKGEPYTTGYVMAEIPMFQQPSQKVIYIGDKKFYQTLKALRITTADIQHAWDSGTPVWEMVLRQAMRLGYDEVNFDVSQDKLSILGKGLRSQNSKFLIRDLNPRAPAPVPVVKVPSEMPPPIPPVEPKYVRSTEASLQWLESRKDKSLTKREFEEIVAPVWKTSTQHGVTRNVYNKDAPLPQDNWSEFDHMYNGLTNEKEAYLNARRLRWQEGKPSEASVTNRWHYDKAMEILSAAAGKQYVRRPRETGVPSGVTFVEKMTGDLAPGVAEASNVPTTAWPDPHNAEFEKLFPGIHYNVKQKQPPFTGERTPEIVPPPVSNAQAVQEGTQLRQRFGQVYDSDAVIYFTSMYGKGGVQRLRAGDPREAMLYRNTLKMAEARGIKVYVLNRDFEDAAALQKLLIEKGITKPAVVSSSPYAQERSISKWTKMMSEALTKEDLLTRISKIGGPESELHAGIRIPLAKQRPTLPSQRILFPGSPTRDELVANAQDYVFRRTGTPVVDHPYYKQYNILQFAWSNWAKSVNIKQRNRYGGGPFHFFIPYHRSKNPPFWMTQGAAIMTGTQRADWEKDIVKGLANHEIETSLSRIFHDTIQHDLSVRMRGEWLVEVKKFASHNLYGDMPAFVPWKVEIVVGNKRKMMTPTEAYVKGLLTPVDKVKYQITELEGDVFSQARAKIISETLSQTQKGTWRGALYDINTVTRSIMTVADHGFGSVMGLTTFFNKPHIAIMAIANVLNQMLPGTTTYSRYIAGNLSRCLEYMKLGHGTFYSSEFVEGMHDLGHASIFSKAVSFYERSFNIYVDTLRLEWWKSCYHPGMSAQEAFALGDMIDNWVGTFNTERLGMNRNETRVETLLFFAPRYMRSNISTFTDIANGTIKMKMGIEFVTRAVVVHMMSYVFACRLAGQDPQLNPLDANFMKINIGGINLRFSSGFITELNILFKLIAYAFEIGMDIKNGDTQDMYQNLFNISKLPFDFLRAKLSPVLGFGVDVLTGQTAGGDYIYNSPGAFGTYAVAPRVMPFYLNNMANLIMDSQKTPRLEWWNNEFWGPMFAEYFGMVPARETFGTDMRQAKNQLAKKLGWPSWSVMQYTLPAADIKEILVQHPEIVDLELKNAQTLNQMYGWNTADWIQGKLDNGKVILAMTEAASKRYHALDELEAQHASKKIIPAEYRYAYNDINKAYYDEIKRLGEVYPQVFKNWNANKFSATASNPFDMAYLKYTLIVQDPKWDRDGEFDYKGLRSATDAFEKDLIKNNPNGEELFQYCINMSTVGRGMTTMSSHLAQDKKIISDQVMFNKKLTSYWDLDKYDKDGKPNPERYQFRAENPKIDALLFTWGYASTLQSERAYDIVLRSNIMFDLGLQIPLPYDTATMNKTYQDNTDMQQKLRDSMLARLRPGPVTQLYMTQEADLYNTIRNESRKLTGDLDVAQVLAILSDIEELSDEYRSLTNLALKYIEDNPEDQWGQWLLLEIEKNRKLLHNQVNKNEIWRFKK